MTSSHREKTVALVNPLWYGHHPMHFNQFLEGFLRCGARVIALCPQPAVARENLARSLGPHDALSLAGGSFFHPIATGGRSFFGGRFEGDPIRTFIRWKRVADALADAEAECGLHADLVFFPYLDSYLRFLPVPMIPEFLLDRAWSGLYLRNHHHGEPASPLKSLRMLLKGDALMRSRSCRGIGVLDERFIAPIEKLTGKSVTAYPDVTQGGLPPVPHPLAVEIRAKAAGRTVVGMIGLERRKGLLTLIRTAALAHRKKLPYHFVCAGAISLGEYSAPELAEIEETEHLIQGGMLDNLHFSTQAGRIPGEEDFNSVFSTFDIAWAAYENFHGSSGTLGKAALFEIPCIASAGECIGHRVETYRTGLTIPESTPENALAAISHLAAGTDWQGLALAPRYADFRDHHSQARLVNILDRLLTTA